MNVHVIMSYVLVCTCACALVSLRAFRVYSCAPCPPPLAPPPLVPLPSILGRCTLFALAQVRAGA